MRQWILGLFIFLFAHDVWAGSAMFNVCDSCQSWSTQKTARFLTLLDSLKAPYSFLTIGPTGVFTNQTHQCREHFEGYAIYFEDEPTCREALRRFKIKCELSVITVTVPND